MAFAKKFKQALQVQAKDLSPTMKLLFTVSETLKVGWMIAALILNK